MSLTTRRRNDEPAASTPKQANLRRGGALARAGLAIAMLFGVCALAAGCGGGSSRPAVASLGKTTTTSVSTTTAAKGTVNPAGTALAFVGCMRSHGEPNMPEPSVSRNGLHATVSINVGAGLDPNSQQFTAAYAACKHLLPNEGGPSKSQAITPSDQADYVRAAACMRTHGLPDFPDPTFLNDTVSFRSTSAIDTNSSPFKSALATCQKLIPAGLPYSSSSGP